MATTSPLVELDDLTGEDSGIVISNAPAVKPTDGCALLQGVASGSAYNKTRAQRMQAKLGFLARRNAKTAGKKVVSYAIGKIPLVGSELNVLFNFGCGKAEKLYKSKKMKSMQRKDVQNGHDSEATTLAELKSMTLSNCMNEIDASYKKVRMTADKLNGKLSGQLSTCDDVLEVYYRFYRMEARMMKADAKIMAVAKTLKKLQKDMQAMHESHDAAMNEFTQRANEFCDDHLGLGRCEGSTFSKFGKACINDDRSMETGTQKGRLLTGFVHGED